MADYVHPTTREIVLSHNGPGSPWVVISRADAETALAIPAKYRKWVTDHIEEMSTGEKATVDAAELTAVDDARMAQLNVRDVVAALALTMRDEINILRAQHSLAARTVTQLKNAIRANLEAL